MQDLYSLAQVSEEYGEFISQVVRNFAESMSLKYDLWHKGAPIWIITDLDWAESNIGPRVNKLEVGVFRTDNVLEIKVLPDAYRIKTSQRWSMRSESRQVLSQRVSFDDFLMAVNQQGRDGAKDILRPKLYQAWNETVAIEDNALMPPTEQGRVAES